MTQLPDAVSRLQKSMINGGETAFSVVPKTLANVIENRIWAECSDAHGNAFGSFEAFVNHKLWWGLESSIDDLLAYCRKAPEVQALIKSELRVLADPGGARKEGEQGTTIPCRGGNPTYTLSRLKRDAPDLAQDVIDGKLSANAAAIKAGFRKKTWTAPDDVEELAAAIKRRYPGWRLVRS